MAPLVLVFINSFEAAVIITMCSETAWQAALLFGHYSMTLLTVAALLASLIGMMVNYGLGYAIALTRHNWSRFNESTYNRITRIFSRYALWIVFFQWLPYIGLVAVIAGMLRVPPRLLLLIVAAGRIAYYGYWFFIHRT